MMTLMFAANRTTTDSTSTSTSDRCLVEKRMALIKQSRNAKHRFQYLDYITVIKDFIMSERTGNWEGHLSAVGKLLNLIAATGHVNYAKSARLYRQVMHRLPGTQPWLFEKFAEGYHVVRRTKRFWGGLRTDLVIEQVMMKSLKSRGGLTRGRCMTESVRHYWIYSMHKCASVRDAMCTLTQLQHITSEQHVELGSISLRTRYTEL